MNVAIIVVRDVVTVVVRGVVKNVVIYVAQTENGKPPTLEVVGEMPGNHSKGLPPIENDPELRAPSPNRRWYPLQDGSVLLGVIRAERCNSEEQWPEVLDQRLQSSSLVLSNSLSLELDRIRLFDQLNQQKDQIQVLVHQLRNPLTALKTYAQLLMRKLEPESNQRDLVEGLLSEQAQVNKYLLALDHLSKEKESTNTFTPARLLLPPLLPHTEYLTLDEILNPLIDRAEATAKLQGRKWIGPEDWPDWIKQERPISEGIIGEIVANLLENAFKYSPQNASIGLCFNGNGLCVWDSGKPINSEFKEKIFLSGFRSNSASQSPGSGLGLTLGRELAQQLGCKLDLITKPTNFDPSLPLEGNAFVLSLPLKMLLKETA